MKKYYNGYLLVASKKLSCGPWQSIAIYTGPDNKKVEVFAFDCETTEQITKILSEQISEIEFNPVPTGQELKNLNLLRELAKRFSAGQEVPKELLYSVKRNFTIVEKDYCIFLPKE